MAQTITLTVPGTPVPKPRMTQSDRWKKRPCVLRYWAWCDLARKAAVRAGGLPPATSVVEFRVESFFEPPKSWSRKRREAAIGSRHLVRPDASNLLKGAEDSLYEDDSALSFVSSRKRYSDLPRMEITIEFEPSV